MNDLIDIIEKDYHQFDMLQLIDVIGEVFDGEIFFEIDPSLAFPAQDVSGVRVNGRGRAVVSLTMLSLLGITTPLPIGYSDYVSRGRKGSEALREFLSIMQNRLHGLWVDAHRKYSLWGGGGEAARRIFEAMAPGGFAEDGLFLAPALAVRARSADGLKRVIRSIWKDIPVAVEENIGRLTAVENRRGVGRGARLGRGAAAGSKIYDRAAKFRVSLGPLDIDAYKSFLPDGQNHKLLAGIVTRYVNAPLICELEISCRRGDLEPAKAGGSSGSLGRTLRLGRRGDLKKIKKNLIF